MLRIIDARTGEPVDAAPARRGLTRVEVHASGFDTTNLRVLLVADVLVRALEMDSTPVYALLAGGRHRAELRAGAAALGVRPLEDGPETGAGLSAAQVIHVAVQGGAATDGVRIGVAPAHPEDPGPLDDTDPAVLRLALLTRRHDDPVRVEEAVLDEARATLARWRGAVAGWARRPSRPVPDEVRGRLRDAWQDDLDVPGVLEVLRQVETEPDLPDGARFETYAYADRLLGLDLTRDLGASS
ncbi:hypothetical protein GCM10010384_43120 [Streptomyces djakartensis]|uniref:Cysteinyl-tRNA synthetase n=1 Tax=Streptomyces djakartensis TaxID=68193 RepID=A0ABQ3A3N7_9ACTN|nr:hypothetical protein GCM10010384_43120 [Streptomyces djakartensis]